MTATTRRRTYRTVAGIFLVTVAIGLLATTHGKAATKPAPPPPTEVTVMHLAGEDVATYREYPARTHARDLVEVRGRVDGYVDRRTFDIGSDVRAGQVLYVLDVRPYEAEVERARGALRDVSDALAGYHKTGAQRAQQEQLVAALRDATRLSTDRYQGGLDSYLQVLDAQRNLFRSELDLTTLQRQELTSIVELYRALGGGWNQ